MWKIFLTLAFVMMLMSSASAATIEANHFNGDERLIYPVVSTGDAAIDRKINVAIIAELDRFLTSAYKGAQSIGAQVEDVRTSYKVGSNQSGNTVILSIVMTESQYFKGAAHPATWKRTLNFNTSNGELMGLDYLTDIGEGVSVEDLKDRLGRKLREHADREGLFLFEDALPLKQLPEEFYWDENLHVHFIFQNYEVAPYAAGIIDVDIDA